MRYTTAKDLCEHIFHTYPDESQNATAEWTTDFVPSFKQFLQFVVDSGEDFDESKFVVVSHWKPYWLSCNPCHPGTALLHARVGPFFKM